MPLPNPLPPRMHRPVVDGVAPRAMPRPSPQAHISEWRCRALQAWRAESKAPWIGRGISPANLLVFARAYPKASLLVTTPDARPAFARYYGGIEVRFLTLDDLVACISGG